jgi:hypothetical protein
MLSSDTNGMRGVRFLLLRRACHQDAMA